MMKRAREKHGIRSAEIEKFDAVRPTLQTVASNASKLTPLQAALCRFGGLIGTLKLKKKEGKLQCSGRHLQQIMS